ncbi:ANTAR domain-containing response regulator [Sinimarinibacterium flocculans]|uniref:ANTAR domain-containing response regulator n=1 Tax=Sinimarinibacterium flocculans TaxID=985250 RepID=UPI001FE62EE5|nr:ANTAR domain-containing protein [Sinimarinibacterium flocculans]MEC9363733.1 ANTAR domain-containing protein [Pseudomonadota bacterium]
MTATGGVPGDRIDPDRAGRRSVAGDRSKPRATRDAHACARHSFCCGQHRPITHRALTPMRVMLVDDDQHRVVLLRQALIDGGNAVVAQLTTSDDLLTAVAHHQPDVVLIDVDAPTRDTLESLGQIARDRPRPIVLFAKHGDAETARRAMRAGISAYVVDGMPESRLKSVIDVAIARFDEHQALRRELEETKMRLADRRDVDRAKGMLMQRRKITESEAYEQLRKMAMDRNLRIGDAARSLLAAAELL